jgi:hypothetical protein
LEKIEQAATEEASNTKYGFNVFSILRKDDEEVGLHSKFLAELLSPTGSHGIDAFQKLFIDQVVNVAIENQDWERLSLCPNQTYMCQTEVAIKNSGRIDIVLKNHENIIVIENKIHASDQEKQLQRYYEAYKNIGYKPESIYILYLNKYGDPVGAYGKGNLKDIDFAQISYKEDIANWLDACIAEAKPYPHIEHTLLQYRRLVGKLTGDTRSARMKQAHIELLYQKDNFKLAHELSKSLISFQIDLQKKVWKEMIESLKQKGLNFVFCDTTLQVCNGKKAIANYYKYGSGNDNYGIYYKIGSLEGYDINLFLQLKNNLYFGVTASINGKQTRYPYKIDYLAKKIAVLDISMKDSGEKWYLGGNKFPSIPLNFRDVSSVCNIVDKSSRDNWIEQTTNEIVSFIENVKSLGLIDVQSATHTSHNTA